MARLAALLLVVSSVSASKLTRNFVSKQRGGKALQASLEDDIVNGSVCDPTALSRSGYFEITGSEYDDGTQNYFFWMFESRSGNTATDPVVLWLTGGPGCSSTLALLTENGPCKVNEEGTGTYLNPYAWNTNATVIWLDQPAGVGFSYGDEDDKNEQMVGEDVYFFLQSFFEAYPQYSLQPFYVFGESFGGHYAPGVAHYIWQKNTEANAGYVNINLAGLGVGNGLTNPVVQYQYYAEMAMNNSYGIKTVSDEAYTSMVSHIPECVKLATACQTDPKQCNIARTLCGQWETTPYYNTGLNPYDIRIPCEVPGLCYNFTNVDVWLTTPSTLEALHVRSESSTWQSCNNKVNADFKDDWMVGYQGYVKDLLDKANIPVMIYAGDVDFVCNWIGNKAWTLALDWTGAPEFNEQEDHVWNVAGQGESGFVRTAKGFTFLQVFAAGHMVPSDKPVQALAMMQTFTSGRSFY